MAKDKNTKKLDVKKNIKVSNGIVNKTEHIKVETPNNATLKIKNGANGNKTISLEENVNFEKEVLTDKTKTKALHKKSNKAKAQLKSTKVLSDSGLQGKKAKVLRKDNTGKLLVGLSAISLVLIMVVMGQFFILESSDPSNTLYKGTTINGVNVGGLEYSQAEQLLAETFKEKSESFKLNLNYQDKNWSFDKNDFTVNSEIHTIIEEAQKRDQINSSYQNQTAKLEELKKQGVSINVAFNYIFVGLDDKIDKIISKIEVEPINSELKFDNKTNKFVATEHKNGLRVNKEQLYFDINEQFNLTNNVNVEIKTVEEVPAVTKEQNDVLNTQVATFTTYVSDSTGGRKNNVKLALEKFNGMIIEPGEEVSFNKITGPHTLENGYKIATIIYKGQFVDGVGGGVCQASTTLYNALLLANVEILEVHKHTLPVKYVPLATDAMVSEHLADLKFKNNSEYPLLIATSTNSESVSVKIYSHPLDVQIKTRAEVIKTLNHSGDVIKPDTNKEYTSKVLFKGEQYRLTYPRSGYEAVAYLEYYKDGVKIDEKEIRHEIYAPQNGIVIEGIEDVPNGMTIIDGKVEKIEASSADASNVVTLSDLIPANMCP